MIHTLRESGGSIFYVLWYDGIILKLLKNNKNRKLLRVDHILYSTSAVCTLYVYTILYHGYNRVGGAYTTYDDTPHPVIDNNFTEQVLEKRRREKWLFTHYGTNALRYSIVPYTYKTKLLYNMYKLLIYVYFFL